MLRNIKLQSVIWVLGLILTLTGSVYLASDYMTYRNVSQIKDAWGQFQSERAIKGHLVAKLRKTLGYGGMRRSARASRCSCPNLSRQLTLKACRNTHMDGLHV